MTFIFLVAISAGAVLFFARISAGMREEITSTIESEQLRYTKETVNRLYLCQNTDEVIAEIDSLFSDGSHSWFVFADDVLVYDKFYQSTNGIPVKSIDVVDEYIRNGGDATELKAYYNMLVAKADFSTAVQRELNSCEDIISVCFATIGETDYAIGYRTSYNYLLSRSKFSRNMILLQILTYLLCGILVVVVGFFALKRYKNQKIIDALEKELTLKNKYIHQKNITIESVGDNSKSKSVDAITGFYTLSFTRHLLDRLSEEDLQTAGFVYITTEINSADNVKRVKKYAQIADVIKQSITEHQICSVLSNKMFFIAFFNVPEENVLGVILEINRKLKEIDEIQFTITKRYYDDKESILNALETAI